MPTTIGMDSGRIDRAEERMRARDDERATVSGKRGRALAVNVPPAERWASMIGGAALALSGLTRGLLRGLPLTGLGLYLIRRGSSGHCEVYQALGVDRAKAGAAEDRLHVRRSITIMRPQNEVYRFWRNLENFPSFMRSVESVRDLGDGKTHWVIREPGGFRLAWDAQIVAEREGELIRWRTLPPSPIEHVGTVNFRPAPGGRGTEVSVVFTYEVQGVMREAVAAILRVFESERTREELRRMKEILETGEVPTTKGQPHGGER